MLLLSLGMAMLLLGWNVKVMAAPSQLEVAKAIPYVRKYKGADLTRAIDLLKIAKLDPRALNDDQIREAMAIVAMNEWGQNIIIYLKHHDPCSLMKNLNKLNRLDRAWLEQFEKPFKTDIEFHKLYSQKAEAYYEAVYYSQHQNHFFKN